jgi:hypothetical protein
MGFEGRVCASKWLKRIGNRSLLVIEEEDGTPFIGSVRARASKVNMSSYWKERDGWRAKDGLDQKWTGTNMAMAPSLLRRNGGLEDCATMLRLSAGKRWEYSRHNVVMCKACSGNMRGLRHPLLKCNHLRLGIAREEWKKSCYKFISKAKPERLRPVMIEIFSNMVSIEDGEFACMGTFTPAWVAHLGVRELPDLDLRAIKKFLRHAVFGARGLMREYARIREVAEGDARPLRQLSIMQYVVEEVPLEGEKKKKRTVVDTASGTAPPIGSWQPSLGGWGRVHWSGGAPYAPPCASPILVGQRQRALDECGFEGIVNRHPKVTEAGDPAGGKTSGTGNSVRVDGNGVAVAWECMGSPAGLNGGGEARKVVNSSRMRTLFPDPRDGQNSDRQLQFGLTSAQPRGGYVLHGPSATGGAYRP